MDRTRRSLDARTDCGPTPPSAIDVEQDNCMTRTRVQHNMRHAPPARSLGTSLLLVVVANPREINRNPRKKRPNPNQGSRSEANRRRGLVLPPPMKKTALRHLMKRHTIFEFLWLPILHPILVARRTHACANGPPPFKWTTSLQPK